MIMCLKCIMHTILIQTHTCTFCIILNLISISYSYTLVCTRMRFETTVDAVLCCLMPARLACMCILHAECRGINNIRTRV